MAKIKRKLKKTRKKPERSQKRDLSVFLFCVGEESGELAGSGCCCCLRPLTTRDWFTAPLLPVCFFVNVCLCMCFFIEVHITNGKNQKKVKNFTSL